ncbi:hypothetical protein ACSQ67_020611 [Phaseolus vulgaris]
MVPNYGIGCERGNQRDRDRERAQARAGGKTKHLKNHGFTPQQRRERNRVLENDEFANIHAPTVITRVGKIITKCCDQLDAKALQEKAAKKAVQDSGGNNAGGGRDLCVYAVELCNLSKALKG